MPICILSCLSVAAVFSGSVFVFDMEVSLSILCVKVQTCKQCLTMISVFNIEVIPDNWTHKFEPHGGQISKP